MPVDHKSEMQCAEFDLLLADALDGVLSGARASRFEQHKTACAKCNDLFAETKAGFELLNTLDEVEPPRHLVHNILVATSGVSEQASVVETEVAPVTSSWQRIWLGMRPVFAPIFTPRFGGSLAMAFFSITMVLNVAGFKIKDISHLDRRTISSRYYAAQTRAIKYYDNIRLVYEFETRVRNLRRSTGGSNEQNQEKKDTPKKNDSNKNEPDQRENNYSRQESTVMLAGLDAVDELALREPARQRRTL